MKHTLVSLTGIGVRYRERPALDGVSFELRAGEVVGLVGPNGAGKTTLLKVVCGLIAPRAGSGRVLGERIAPDRRPVPFVGLMPEKPAFIEHLSGRTNLRMLARIRGAIGRGEVDGALVAAGLDPADRRPVRAYSQGMRQRLSLAQATMEAPRVVLLDEPTNGLDPHGVVDMRGMIRAVADGGAGIVLSSHLLTEVEVVCDRVVLIDGGRTAGEYKPGVPESLEAAYLAAVGRRR